MENQEIIDNIKKTTLKIARNEAIKQLKCLYFDVIKTLRYNPHNTFKGTASEYIRKYGLAKKLKREIYNKFGI